MVDWTEDPDIVTIQSTFNEDRNTLNHITLFFNTIENKFNEIMGDYSKSTSFSEDDDISTSLSEDAYISTSTWSEDSDTTTLTWSED